MRPGRSLAAALIALSALSRSAFASAAGSQPTPEQIEFAAQEHDLGYRAYVAKQFDEAATHFENAFFAAANPAELRSAIRARRDAGELARAATLAAIAVRKYPNDAAVTKLATETITFSRPHVVEVHVSSPEECNVAVDQKIVASEMLEDFGFFVEPGKHELLIGWSDARTKRISIEGKAGVSETLTATPPPPPPPLVAKVDPPLPPPPSVTGAKPLGPAVFFAAGGVAFGRSCATIWSGVDATEHPGAAAVRTGCVGQGTNCALYQQGLDAQRRTNILLAATGGAVVVTAVIGIFLTRWGHSDPVPSGRLTIEPTLGFGNAGLQGTF